MAELKELAEFYARAAAMKDPVIKHKGRNINAGPDTNSYVSHWTVEERQPDFQCLIDSGIDCEFSNDREHWYIGKLSRISSDKLFHYSDRSSDSYFKYCRPRLNHIHAWIATEDSKCPVPDGYKVEVYLASNEPLAIVSASELNWAVANYNRIVAFKVLPK